MKHSIGTRLKATAVCAAVMASTLLPCTVTGEKVNAAGGYNYAQLLQQSMYFYDANMCGDQVDENSRYVWRGDCHTYDAQVPMQPITDGVGTNLSQSFMDKYADVLDPDGDGFIDVAGGMHDAGDHVEFGMPENYSAAALGWGYYEFRDSYVKTGQDGHIETILRYFNDYLMKCTFRDASGTVIAHCYQVGDGDIDHVYWNSPEVDEMARPAFFLTAEKPQTDYVVSAAGSLAINYLNFKDTDPEYAEKSLDYAKALWQFAEDNPKELSDNADGPKQYYGSSKWEDDYCWAAAWLFLCTEDKSYLEAAAPYLDYYAPSGWCFCWNDMWSGTNSVWGIINQTYPELGLVDMVRTAQGKNQYVYDDFWDEVEKCFPVWQGLESPGGYAFLSVWGSARYNTAMQLIAYVYDKYNNDGKPGEYSDWAKSQMDYILGDNPLNRCYVVGYSDNAVKFPHHRAASGLTKCEDPDDHRYVLYGALVGGPDGDDKHNDTTADYIYNEVTIDYNAAFVGAAAGIYAYYGDESMEVIPDFPPEPEYGGDDNGNGGGVSYWAEACGIDDKQDTGAGVTKVSLMVKTTAAKKLDNISIRYYYNGSEMSNPMAMEGSELYDQAATEAAPADGVISGPYKYDKLADTYYFEITFDGYNFANSAKKYQFTMGTYYGDKWDPTNDWSYDGLKIYTQDDAFFGTGNEVRNDNICIYTDGKLIGGIEPDGSEPEVEEPTTEPTSETTPKPTTTTSKDDEKPTSSAAVNGDAVYGDVNCDNKIDVLDVITLNKNLLGGGELTEQGIRNADVDLDDAPTVADSLTILKYIISLVDKLPVA